MRVDGAVREDQPSMVAPHWWKQRRFGLMLQANLASVPSWAPIGEYAAWYQAHVDPDVSDVLLHPSPLVETLAHHRDRWAHVESHDDFLPFLTFDEFDPDEWTGLARDAGMSYAVMVAKHHDGLCWWDAPGTDRTVLDGGPTRNILGEFAAACERSDLVFGTSYSLLDWSDERYPGCTYVDEVVHPQILDLVSRYGSRMLWGDGHWGAGGEHWRSDQLIAKARTIDPEIVVNDRWWAGEPTARTFEYRVPDGIVTTPWEMRRALGTGIGHNRNERDEHLITAAELVSLLAEVVAKGGHLLVVVGADASGRVPELVADRLRAAGGWIRRHTDLVDRGEPWRTWGDDDCRYLVVDGVLYGVDVSGRGRFAALTRGDGVVRAISSTDGTVAEFEQDERGVILERRPRSRSRLPVVYRIDLDAPPEPPIELFATAAPEPIELAPLLDGAARGAIVQLGDGRYVGPARIPEGVTVRGLGPDRTTIDGREGVAIALGDRSRLEHCSLTGGGDRIVWLPKHVVAIPGASASLLGCHVDGHVHVTGHDARIASCRATGVVAAEAERLEIRRSTFSGMQWDCAIDVTGGTGLVIEGSEFHDVLVAVRVTGAVGSQIRGNQIHARWWGVQLVDTDGSVVFGNSVAGTMRAIDVDGGTLAQITGNAVSDGDSGCLAQRGASDVEVTGNHWERCRVGLITWDAGTVRHHDNAAVDLLEPDSAVLIGP
jgi:alpha-L-fucosidase